MPRKASELTEGETCEPYKVNGVEVKGVCRIRGFLEEAMIRESTDHTGGESATEAFVNQFHGQIGNPPIGAWGFPADAIWHSYAAMTPPLYVCRSVIPTPLGDKVLDLSWWCESSGMNEQLASDEGQEVWSSKIVHVDYEINGQWQWIAENLVTWPVGGLDDMANHTLAAWLHYWDLLVGRPEVAGVTIAGPSEGEPGTYTFTAAFEPADASPPVGWLWDNGATKPVLTRELVEEGTYTLWVTATNYWGGPLAKTSHTIAVQDGEGEEPCPAGPELAANCDPEPPPYYAVVNGQQDCLERTGSACSPFVLGHPECTNCATCNVDVQSELCEPYLTGVVPEGQTETLYEMCQAGTRWLYRVRTLDSMGNCPLDDPNWSSDPPVTGVDLPAPLIVAGMALLGVCFLGLGAVVRRKVVC